MCVNHSCKPNCFFNIETMTLEAVEDIEPGTELFFFYPSTEWDMEQSFQCHCGEDNCIRTIMGAKYLPLSILKQYNLSPYIQNCLAEGI
ncbi:MAG: SET domain-containing protein-lysine N-methyltransferase [Saprospiraceae bacterium]|nr:SET domain-containing protein-lysine N-methyltransferase [Saprospiraceae bacterium]